MTSCHRAVVVGGGAVGGMFAQLLRDGGASVTVVDVAARGDLRADVTAPSPELIAVIGAADTVLLALPEAVTLKALPEVTAVMAAGALLVDTSSVKAGIVDAGPPGREWVSVNPMFAPSLGMRGRPVAAIVAHGGERVEGFLAEITGWGGRVVRMSAVEHDRIAAVTQSMTHAAILAFGLAVRDLGLPLETLAATAPPPHQSMLALLARLMSQSPEVYWDIQAANPHAAHGRAALADGLRRLADLVDAGDTHGFDDALGELRSLFGDDLAIHRDRCARMFAILQDEP
ncbi:prephenate dehydrogenase/arogenate dehydrogenase family protein [Actinoplanes regularis]|uniref:Prephenate dehydrogenase n=1 Tax=Actinoplanes regularis TaxID=52697 RepID=A0A239BFM9_9ACTN|nr:prephenate dehydrogenase/arogenate dehydrogenase family protein [Actinoplanes regularis]SNS06412.1 prephenate dehydrogenase [Actinoplanes regularis]